MLRVNPTQLPSVPDETLQRQADPTLKTIGTALRRSLWIIVAAALTGLILATAFCLLATPTYVATAQLLIEPQKQQQLLLFEPGMLDLTLDNAQVESQVEVLRSERLAAAVVAILKLGTDREFQADLTGATTDPEDLSGTEEALEARRLRMTTANLVKHIGVRRVGQSYVIELLAWSTRPDLAAKIANAYATTYLSDQFDAKAQGARQGVDWLKLRISELRTTLNDSARAVEDFKAKNGLVTAGTTLLVEQQLSEMNSELVAARSQVTQAASKLERVRAIGVAAAGSATVGEALSNPVITNLRERQQDAITKEAEFRDRYGPAHEAVIKAHADAAKVEDEIAAELQRIAQTYLSDYEVAIGRERALRGEVNQLVAEVDARRQSKVVLSEMEAQTDSYRKMYQSLLEKLTETAQKETLPVSNARIVSPASAPLGKSSPKTTLILALGAAFGLLGGALFATVRESLDRTVRTSEEVLQSARVECLGLLPVVPYRQSAGPKGQEAGLLGLHVLDAPFSAFTRALCRARISIDASRDGRRVTTIGVASIGAGEGKTTIALNLGALYAQANFRTLLIDADFRTGSLTRAQAPTATAGLIEMLGGAADAIRPLHIPNLSLLPLVFSTRTPQSSDILSSRQTRELLTSLGASYDIIILDFTGMQEAADVRATSRLLDGLLLIAAWGKTEASALSEASAALGAGHVHLFGVLLNKVRDPSAVSRSF